MVFSPINQLFLNLHSGITMPMIDASIEIQFHNSIKIYKGPEAFKERAQLVVKYLLKLLTKYTFRVG